MRCIATTLLCLLWICVQWMKVHSLAFHSVRFPLTQAYNTALDRSLYQSFDTLVASTDFFIKGNMKGECSVPLFGDARVSFQPEEEDSSSSTAFLLAVQGDDVSDTDFAWICTKFFECRDDFHGLQTKALRRVVAHHMNAQPPHTGYEATLSASDKVASLFESNSDMLTRLEKDGFVVVDQAVLTTNESNEKLSDFIVHQTGQSRSVRRDLVGFLDRNDTIACGLKEQYDLLLGIAEHLNNNLCFEESPYSALAPGTREKPLSNPKHIQAAAYGHGDFYVSHSDNSLTSSGTRSNYRCYTCILYCNSDWNLDDHGGALRIYPKTSNLLVPSEVNGPFVDINPANGRLLIFDSTLVHSVEPVLAEHKIRRALTLWILRPEDSGVEGEVYYFGQDED